MNGWMDGWMDENARIDGWMDGWMDAFMNVPFAAWRQRQQVRRKGNLRESLECLGYKTGGADGLPARTPGAMHVFVSHHPDKYFQPSIFSTFAADVFRL